MLGSYYVNPTHDAAKASKELKDKFPEYTHPNVWPPPDVLPGFKEAFEALGRLIVDVGALLGKVAFGPRKSSLILRHVTNMVRYYDGMTELTASDLARCRIYKWIH